MHYHFRPLNFWWPVAPMVALRILYFHLLTKLKLYLPLPPDTCQSYHLVYIYQSCPLEIKIRHLLNVRIKFYYLKFKRPNSKHNYSFIIASKLCMQSMKSKKSSFQNFIGKVAYQTKIIQQLYNYIIFHLRIEKHKFTLMPTKTFLVQCQDHHQQSLYSTYDLERWIYIYIFYFREFLMTIASSGAAGLPKKIFIEFSRFDLHKYMYIRRGCCTSSSTSMLCKYLGEDYFICIDDVVFASLVCYVKLIHKTGFVFGVEIYFVITNLTQLHNH